jgi:hypothetical protein
LINGWFVRQVGRCLFQVEEIKSREDMKRKTLALAVAILFVGLLAITRPASAHETITVGDYDVEYGWVNEPAIVGQPNDVSSISRPTPLQAALHPPR